MKLILEIDPLNESEVREAKAILTILGAEAEEVVKPGITASPEDRKDPAAEKAAADKAKADAAAKNKADAAAAKVKADAEAKAKADAEAAAKAKAEEEAAAAAKAEEEAAAAAEDNDDFLDGGEEAQEYTIEDVRGALKAYASKHTKEKAVKILKDNGASTIGDLAVEKYAIVMALAKVED